LVQSIAMPTAINGVQKRLVASGTAASEGQMTRTADGRFLVRPGYDVTPPAAAFLTFCSWLAWGGGRVPRGVDVVKLQRASGSERASAECQMLWTNRMKRHLFGQGALLSDGTRMTGEMPIKQTMRLPLFSPMYDAFSGGITGEMELNHGGIRGDVQGTDLLWFRPVLNRVPFPIGWLEGITLDGRADAQP
jgi:hypothetical protein